MQRAARAAMEMVAKGPLSYSLGMNSSPRSPGFRSLTVSSRGSLTLSLPLGYQYWIVPILQMRRLRLR